MDYISSYNRNKIAENTARVNDNLQRLQALIEAKKENIEDLRKYIRNGADYKVKAVIADCQRWLDESKAPKYIREDALQKAHASISEEEKNYYRKIASSLNIRFGQLSSDPMVNLQTDIEVGEDGKWRLKSSFIEMQANGMKRYLTDREEEDYKELMRLREEAHKFEDRGYNITALLEAVWNAEDERVMENLNLDYSPKKDKREKA